MGIAEGILLGAICCIVVFSVCLLTNGCGIGRETDIERKIKAAINRIWRR